MSLPRKDGNASEKPPDERTGSGEVSYLPILLLLRSDLRTVQNQIDTYEQICLKREWTGQDVTQQQARVVAAIQRRLQAACDRMDVSPMERLRLQQELYKQRQLVSEIRTTNTMLQRNVKP
jgi:hypothetical protein